MSASGQVVGNSYTAFNREAHAFSWTAMLGMLDLGTLGGTVSHAYAMNDAGQVVGFSVTASIDGAAEVRPTLWNVNEGVASTQRSQAEELKTFRSKAPGK